MRRGIRPLLGALLLLAVSCSGDGERREGVRHFRFVDWVRENGFEVSSSRPSRTVFSLRFPDEAGAAKVLRAEDSQVAPVEGRLRVTATGPRPRVIFECDFPSRDADVLMLDLVGDRNVEPRMGWAAESDGRRVTSRGVIPMALLEERDGRRQYYLSATTNESWTGRVYQLMLQLELPEGGSIDLEEVHALAMPFSRQWMRFEGRDDSVGRAKIGVETRQVILAPPPARIEAELVPAESPLLRFGYGVLPFGWVEPAWPVTFRVEARAGGETRVLFERTLDPASRSDEQVWFRERLELDEYAGRPVRLALVTRTEGTPGREVPAVWSTPVVESPREQGDPPNVVLVSLDTQRADRTGCYGYPRGTTPGLDRFARNAVQLRAATSHASTTGPSHMSLFTSLYPTMHGVTNPTVSLDESVTTLAELFREAGYTTEALTNGGYIRAELGFHQGFDAYRDQPYLMARETGRAADMVDRAIESLERMRRRPFVLFLHSYEVHVPYCPVEPFADLFDDPSYAGRLDDCIRTADVDRLNHGCLSCEELTEENLGTDPPDAQDIAHVNDLYDAGVRQLDHEIERLLRRVDELGLRENTLVLFFADHGEDLGDHDDLARHGRSLYEEIVNVPLLMRFPGELEPRVVDEALPLVDVLPTIVELLRLAPLDAFQGRSFLPLLRGEAAAPDASSLYSENFRHGRAIRIALRKGRYKVIRTRSEEVLGEGLDWDSVRLRGMRPRVELYDLERDPREQRDLAPSDPRAAELRRELDAFFDEQSRRSIGSRALRLDTGLQRRLRELGYLRDDDPGGEESGDDEESER